MFVSYYLAKHSVSIVSDITQNKFTVKDFFTFLDKILMQCNHLEMASLDVDCLSTNIPLDESINSCINKLFQNSKILVT